MKTNKKSKGIKDKDIRFRFIARNLDVFKKPNTEFVNEFGINSTNIVDLAFFDFNENIFYGFEIKSEKDNLKRLYKQLNAYATFFNIVYVVAHTSHIENIFELIRKFPHLDKVGIIEVTDDFDFIELKRARKFEQYKHAFISNLDKEELSLICESHNKNIHGSKRVLVDRIKTLVSLDDIFEWIHHKLNKYYVKKCQECGSNLYYNKTVKGHKASICYECGHIISLQ